MKYSPINLRLSPEQWKLLAAGNQITIQSIPQVGGSIRAGHKKIAHLTKTQINSLAQCMKHQTGGSLKLSRPQLN